MKFEPSKSRCLVVKKGKITQRFRLKIQGEEIPSKVDNLIKCLGKRYDDTLKDVNNSRRLERETTEILVHIDKTGLPGFKAWIFQHGLLPRLIWPLILYKSKTRMTKMVGIAGAYIQSRHKWRANEAELEAESRHCWDDKDWAWKQQQDGQEHQPKKEES